MKQKQQIEWNEQWTLLRDNELFLFRDWIFPTVLEDFSGKEVLECGCGGGQHTSFVAPLAKRIVAVDLNTVEVAKKRAGEFTNVEFITDDIATMDLGGQFDIAFSVGVVHHTDNPDKTFKNIKRHVKSGGKLIVWVYSKEGNFLVEKVVEPVRKLFLRGMKRKGLLFLSKILTFFLYIPVYSIYLLPLEFLPYYQYFGNFRRLSFYRNTLNVFDKLNAPQVTFITKERISGWFNEKEFTNVHIDSYKGVSWRASGIKS